jgi:hypothetical protein
VALVQSAHGEDSAPTLPGAPTPGNLIVIAVGEMDTALGFTEALSGPIECNGPTDIRMRLWVRAAASGDDGVYAMDSPGPWIIGEFDDIASIVAESVDEFENQSATTHPQMPLTGTSYSGDVLALAIVNHNNTGAALDADVGWTDVDDPYFYASNNKAFSFLFAIVDGGDAIEPGAVATASGQWGGAVVRYGMGVAPPSEPPVDPGYEDPGTGHAILEIYVHDEDATRWGTATWSADLTPTGTEGIWSGAGWQDVTPQGLTAHVSWGTSQPDRGILAIQEAQSWLVTTYDPDRVLDPGNPDSPYAPQLVSGVPIRISSSVSGRVIRTGVIDRIAYKYKAPDYRGTIQASSTIALAWRADVPDDSILGDTLRERIQDAVAASGIALGGIPLLGNDDSYPEVPLSPRIEGEANLWEHIYKAGEEALWVIYEDAAGTFQARPWGGPLDRGSEITYENLEDLEAASTEDGVYSVVRVTDDTTPTPVVIERVAAPLPRYGRRVYTRSETTINADAWADAVLADRAWPGVRWTPGTVWCFTAADIEFMTSLEIMERVGIVVPGVVDVSGRLLGMEMWVEAKTDTETRWLFLPRIAVDGATSLGTTILVSDDGTGDYLVDDEGDGEYLEYEG